MKFWKKIFLYSLILFLLLFNGGGIILIEKIHSENLNTAIKTLMYKYLNVESVMYLNSDYLMNIEVNSESNMKNWMDIIINGYSVNNVEQYSTELYSMENKEITSDLKEKIFSSYATSDSPFTPNEPLELNVKELQAINKQVEELGWK